MTVKTTDISGFPIKLGMTKKKIRGITKKKKLEE